MRRKRKKFHFSRKRRDAWRKKEEGPSLQKKYKGGKELRAWGRRTHRRRGEILSGLKRDGRSQRQELLNAGESPPAETTT